MNGNPQKLELLEHPSPESLLPDSGFSQWWIVAGVALLVLIVAVVIMIARKRKSSAPSTQTLRNAARADAVTELSRITAADARDAAIQCSLILRRYLSIAAADPALFETHEEFVSRHDALQQLTAQSRLAAATGFTRLATMKYAPEIPAEPAAGKIISDSRSLLETLHHGFSA
ncbi:MAG: DUF4381 family protein [Verrucomicrobiota bacterium]